MVWIKTAQAMAFIGLVTLLTGCLSSSQHFRKGELLKSGNSEVNWGIGYTHLKICDGEHSKDSDGVNRCDGEWKDMEWVPFSRSWRLGVRDSWGPFTGVELGYYIETNLTVEFDLRLGLPLPSWYPLKSVQHAVGAGWSLGFFPDNTYFIDYALSKKFANHTLYATIRESFLATQLLDTEFENDPEEAGDLFAHHRQFYHQLGIGMEVLMPVIFMFPDQLHFQLILSAPGQGFIGEPRPRFYFQPQLNFGVGWHY